MMISAKRIMLCITVLTSALAALSLASFMPAATQASGNPQWTGLIDSRPSPGLTGTWGIGGLSFTATNTTVFDEVAHALNTNTCARVEYFTSSGVNIATQIQAKEAYECGTGGGETGDHLKVYTWVNRLPSGFPTTLTGDWVIGNITYTAVITTRFATDHGQFAVGQCAEVEFISNTDHTALEIGTESDYKCTGFTGGVILNQAYGVVNSFPAGLTGTWMISGIVYTATASTRFEQEHGPFFVGACVEVKFDATRTAVEISREDAYKCGAGSGTITTTVKSKFFGLITTIPSGTFGIWTIGGGPFIVTTTTELKTEHGPLVVGACAGVTYIVSGTNKLATEIESEELYQCNTSTFTNEVYGKIGNFPSGLFGTWIISTSVSMTDTYSAESFTQFQQAHGAFAAGACVKVKYFFENGVNRAVEIETEEANRCNGVGTPPTLPAESKVFAAIDFFPPSPFIGSWGIGGVVYSATVATQFTQSDGPYAVGACVKAKYSITQSVRLLGKVETEDAYKCTLTTTNPITAFKSYGVVESFPTSLIGNWQISGITYTTNISTYFQQEHGFFAVGAFVEVKYVISDNVRTVLELETHVAPHAGLITVTGILEAHDANDDWSPWQVNGVTYQSDHAIEVGDSSSASRTTARGPLRASGGTPAVGQLVVLNIYRSNGVSFVTFAAAGNTVYLPLIMR
jgi:hypothetical protein